MKVTLGPYVSRWISDVHSKHMNSIYDFDWPAEKDYTRKDRFYERLDDVLQWIYNHTVNLYLDRKQRKIKVRIDYHDVWGADHTLALIIAPTLKLLKEKLHGAPMVDDEDVPEHLRSTAAPATENEWDTDDNHFKRWDWVIDEMIFAFEASAMPDWESQFYSGEHDMRFVPVDKNGNEVPKDEAKFHQMKRGSNDTFAIDTEGRKAYYERMKNGRMLFAKYYDGLWD